MQTHDQLSLVADLETAVSDIFADTPPTNARDIDVAIRHTAENIRQAEKDLRAMDAIDQTGTPGDWVWIEVCKACVAALQFHLRVLIDARLAVMSAANSNSKSEMVN